MATSAAAAVAVARRKVVSHFMAQNAVSPGDAVAFEPERRLQRKQFERMRDAGVIEDAGDDRYWLNVPMYDQWKGRIRKRIGLMVGAGVAAAAIAALFAG